MFVYSRLRESDGTLRESGAGNERVWWDCATVELVMRGCDGTAWE